MSKNYDNWEKLVEAVMRREQLRRLAMSRSISSISCGTSSRSSVDLSYVFPHPQSIVCKWDSFQLPEYNGVFHDPSKWVSLLPPAPDDHPRLIIPLYAKLCFLVVGSRNLIISCQGSSDEPQWRTFYSGRFPAAELESVWSMDVRGKMKTQLLTPKTIYGAYLVFEPTNKCKSLESAKASVRFVDDETDSDAEDRAETVDLRPVNERMGGMAVSRTDGWLEVQIGKFYLDHQGDDEEVEAHLAGRSRWKTGLVVQGIEFRPLYVLKRS